MAVASASPASLAFGMLLGVVVTTALLGLADGLRPARRRQLAVSGFAVAVGLALGAGQLLGGSAAALLARMLPGGALLLMCAPLRLDVRLLGPLVGLGWIAAAADVPGPIGEAVRLPWASLPYLLALPLVIAAAWRVRRREGAGWLGLAVAGCGVAAFAPGRADGVSDLFALAMAAVLVGLHQALRASLDAQAAAQQAALADAGLAHQAARLHDEHARFFSFIAHELRSPLGVLLVGLSNLRRAMPDGENAARIARVSNAAQRMSGLIDRHACLLSLVRSDFEPARSALSPEQPAVDALRALRSANPDRVFVHAAPDCVLPPVFIDPELVTLALSNLLENAVKYAAEDSPIRLELEAGAEAIHYRVINDGPPLPPGLVDPAYPIRLPMKGAEGARGGFGIGLALAARVAGVHGGRLTGASADGRTTFTLTLPCEPGARTGTPA